MSMWARRASQISGQQKKGAVGEFDLRVQCAAGLAPGGSLFDDVAGVAQVVLVGGGNEGSGDRQDGGGDGDDGRCEASLACRLC